MRRHQLRFEALDTAASVALNGAELGTTANAHRPHLFTVDTGVLREGENELVVTLQSPVAYAAAQAEAYPYSVPATQVCVWGGGGWSGRPVRPAG